MNIFVFNFSEPFTDKEIFALHTFFLRTVGENAQIYFTSLLYKIEPASIYEHSDVCALIDMLGIPRSTRWEDILYFVRLPEDPTIATMLSLEFYIRSGKVRFPRILRIRLAEGGVLTRIEIVDAGERT